MERKSRIIIILFALCIYNGAYGQHLDGFDLVINEVRIVNNNIKSCLNDIIPYITNKYKFNKEKDVICVYFLPYDDLFCVFPKNKFVGLTDWFLYNYNYQVTGYLMIHDVMVILLGNKSLSYIKTKRKQIKMRIENYPPPVDGIYPYWEYEINKDGKKCILIEEEDPPNKIHFN